LENVHVQAIVNDESQVTATRQFVPVFDVENDCQHPPSFLHC